MSDVFETCEKLQSKETLIETCCVAFPSRVTCMWSAPHRRRKRRRQKRRRPASFRFFQRQRPHRLERRRQDAWTIENGTIHYTGKAARTSPPPRTTRTSSSGSIGRSPPKAIAEFYLPRANRSANLGQKGKAPAASTTTNPKARPRNRSTSPTRKVGEWNNMYVKMIGTKVSVVLNGKIVVDNAIFLDGKVPRTAQSSCKSTARPCGSAMSSSAKSCPRRSEASLAVSRGSCAVCPHS